MEVLRTGRVVSPGRVLVVGAGPVGLIAALLLRHHDVEVDILDRRTEPVSESRATDLHPATLERLDPFGVTRDLIDIGRIVRRAVVHVGDRVAGTLPLGRRGSPFPFALTVPQCTTEGQLQEHLARHDVRVERDLALTGLSADPSGVTVALQSGSPASATLSRAYDWVLACDGAGSTVRTALGIEFAGRTMPGAAAIADVEVDLPFPQDELHLALRPGGSVHVLPMPVAGYSRLMVDRWPGPAGRPPDADRFLELVAARLERPTLPVRGVRWMSSFVMHHRVATRLRHGRVLLAGDAAHVCPPIGGQGLNTGIADVVAWVPALISVMTGRAPDETLDIVAARRRDVARRTGGAAWLAAVANTPPTAAMTRVRDAVAPAAMRVGGRAITRWLAGGLDPR